MVSVPSAAPTELLVLVVAEPGPDATVDEVALVAVIVVVVTGVGSADPVGIEVAVSSATTVVVGIWSGEITNSSRATGLPPIAVPARTPTTATADR
ncbi:MAG: hypothetical protein JWN39_1833 [Ilumatobacteraceae bacterium]|nr:hypothetical protein [Ilumatobacteraceae bacterium]